MKILAHNQLVKMDKPAFRYRPKVTVGTVEGYALERGDSVEIAVARCVDNMEKHKGMGHCLAWTTRAASVLTDNYAGKDKDVADENKAYDNATVLFEGETVEIEGRNYIVRYLGDFSDPIAFKPI